MSADRLPKGLHVTEYNGYVFPYDTDTTGYAVRPIRDSARRTVIACTFEISLHWFDNDPEGAGGSLNARAADMVARLTKDAGVLKYEGRGFGTPKDVNASRVRDVDWGPKAGEIKMKPHGGSTIECWWSVTFTLPTCGDAVYNGIKEFCFALDFSRDSHGYTVRTYTAKLAIAQTRATVDSRAIPDTAESYLPSIVPALVNGFWRDSVKRSISEDKSELRLTVVDTQLGGPAPPKNVVAAQASHNFRSESSFKFVSTIEATYDIPLGGTAFDAVKAFFALAKHRFDLAKSASAGGRTAVIPIAASASEPNIYGRPQVNLSMTYRVSNAPFSEIVPGGGLWTPLPISKGVGGSWSEWSASIPNVLSPRGHAGLTFRANEDKIVDLCRAGLVPTTPGSVAETVLGAIASAGIGAIAGLLGAAGAVEAAKAALPPVLPAASWLSYSCVAIVHAATGRIPVTTLPSSPITDPRATGANSPWNPFTAPLPTATGTNNLLPLGEVVSQGQEASKGETVIQSRTRPVYYMTVRGTALRALYGIPVPEVTSVNNAKPVMIGEPYFAQWIEPGSITPLVRAAWEMRYIFTDDTLGGGIPVSPVGPVPSVLA